MGRDILLDSNNMESMNLDLILNSVNPAIIKDILGPCGNLHKNYMIQFNFLGVIIDLCLCRRMSFLGDAC